MAKAKKKTASRRARAHDFLATENNPEIRDLVLATHKPPYVCTACGFDFAATYGEDFASVIDIHIEKKVDKNKHVDARHFVLVCANCHRVLHGNQGVEPLSLRALRQRLKNQVDVSGGLGSMTIIENSELEKPRTQPLGEMQQLLFAFSPSQDGDGDAALDAGVAGIVAALGAALMNLDDAVNNHCLIYRGKGLSAGTLAKLNDVAELDNNALVVLVKADPTVLDALLLQWADFQPAHAQGAVWANNIVFGELLLCAALADAVLYVDESDRAMDLEELAYEIGYRFVALPSGLLNGMANDRDAWQVWSVAAQKPVDTI